MVKYYLGLDIGTSGAKTLLINQSGKVVAIRSNEYPIYTPRQGWSEQEPADWWRSVIKGIKGVLSDSGVSRERISGLGLSGQMHGSVFLGDGTKPLRPAILWNDQRTAKQCEYIEKTAGGRGKLIRMVANPALTGFTAPKIIWLRDNELDTYKKVKHVLLPKDYIRLMLTGEYATEVSDASGTLLFDVRNRKWHYGLIGKLGLDQSWFPRCYESTDITGYITAEASRITGLPENLPVVGGAGDQAAGAVGSGIVKSGSVSATLGTSGVVFAYASKPELDSKGRVHTMCHAVPGKWCVFGCMLSAGGALQWFRNQLGKYEVQEAKLKKIDAYELLTRQAEKAEPGCDGLFFLPYLTGERTPHADPFARGCFIGITARTSRADIIRSVLEGITFGMKDQIEIMRSLGISIREVRSAGGGAKSKFWRKLQSDMYNARVVTTNLSEGAALGAAILSAVGAGQYKSVPEACSKIIKTKISGTPDKAMVQFYNDRHIIYQRLYRDLKGEFSIL